MYKINLVLIAGFKVAGVRLGIAGSGDITDSLSIDNTTFHAGSRFGF